MEVLLALNQKIALRRNNSRNRHSGFWGSLFPTIIPFTAQCILEDSAPSEIPEGFVDMKIAVDALLWKDGKTLDTKSNKLCFHLFMDVNKVRMVVHGNLLDHLYQVCGEGGTLQVFGRRQIELTGTSQDYSAVQPFLFKSQERGISLASKTADDFSREIEKSDCHKLGKYRVVYEDVNLDIPFYLKWHKGELLVDFFARVSIVYKSAGMKMKSGGNFCKRILEGSLHSDLSIKVDSGALVNCHKCFLAAQSPVFAAMLKDNTKESKTNILEIEDTSEECVRTFLECLYTPEKAWVVLQHSSPLVVSEMLQIAHKYHVQELQGILVKLVLEKESAWFEICAALQMFLFARNVSALESVKIKCVEVLKERRAEMGVSQAYRDIFMSNPSAAMDLCLMFSEM